MAYNTFTPPKNPQYPLDIPVAPRLLNPSFAPGDPAYLPDGINVVLRKGVTLKFAPLIQTDFQSIDSFMTANLQTPFLYTLPDETNARLWLLTARTRRVLSTVWEYEVTVDEQPIL
jgi:hypothetical protein